MLQQLQGPSQSSSELGGLTAVIVALLLDALCTLQSSLWTTYCYVAMYVSQSYGIIPPQPPSVALNKQTSLHLVQRLKYNTVNCYTLPLVNQLII